MNYQGQWLEIPHILMGGALSKAIYKHQLINIKAVITVSYHTSMYFSVMLHACLYLNGLGHCYCHKSCYQYHIWILIII